MYLLIASILEMQVVAFGPLFLVSYSKLGSFSFIEFVSFFNFILQSGLFKMTK